MTSGRLYLGLLLVILCSFQDVWGKSFNASEAAFNGNYLRISAFNVQNLGRTKMGRPEVVDALVRIMNKYDIILVQEIVDYTLRTPYQLLEELNWYATDDPFSLTISGRLSRTSSRKEQYGYYYRSSKVTVTETYQWPDVFDVFERPPFVVRFSAPNYQIKDFAMAGLHAKPDYAVSETDGLVDVYDGIQSMWSLQDILLLGDFNAACSYVSDSDWPRIRLRTQSRFQWIIGDRVDTTVGNSYCAYDRIVLAGDNLKAAYSRTLPEGSGWAYRFDEDMGLSQAEALFVSDHYPVQCGLA